MGLGFRSVVSKSMMCLRDKVGHSGEEVNDLGKCVWIRSDFLKE